MLLTLSTSKNQRRFTIQRVFCFALFLINLFEQANYYFKVEISVLIINVCFLYSLGNHIYKKITPQYKFNIQKRKSNISLLIIFLVRNKEPYFVRRCITGAFKYIFLLYFSYLWNVIVHRKLIL